MKGLLPLSFPLCLVLVLGWAILREPEPGSLLKVGDILEGTDRLNGARPADVDSNQERAESNCQEANSEVVLKEAFDESVVEPLQSRSEGNAEQWETDLSLPVKEDSPSDEEADETFQPAVEFSSSIQPLSPPYKLVLPTGNDAIFEKDPSGFYMHTDRYVDGVNLKPWEGGKYGFVRSPLSTAIGPVYTRLHEGIDIRPLIRDAKGEPQDVVGSMADGVVVHVNSSSSGSNYGKYVVVRHDWPEGAFYSLYAHLMTTEVSVGQPVDAGGNLGRLGYTGAGLDRERAHVHVELNFLVSKSYDSHVAPNVHGNFHGSNLLGIDIGRFLREHHENPGMTMKEFLRGEETHYIVRTSSNRKPGILERHPFLGEGIEKEFEAESWEFSFASSGVPLSIRPSEVEQKYPIVTWVKPVNTNHSYLTSSRLTGSGNKAQLSSRGHQFISLISESCLNVSAKSGRKSSGGR